MISREDIEGAIEDFNNLDYNSQHRYLSNLKIISSSTDKYGDINLSILSPEELKQIKGMSYGIHLDLPPTVCRLEKMLKKLQISNKKSTWENLAE